MSENRRGAASRPLVDILTPLPSDSLSLFLFSFSLSLSLIYSVCLRPLDSRAPQRRLARHSGSSCHSLRLCHTRHSVSVQHRHSSSPTSSHPFSQPSHAAFLKSLDSFVTAITLSPIPGSRPLAGPQHESRQQSSLLRTSAIVMFLDVSLPLAHVPAHLCAVCCAIQH